MVIDFFPVCKSDIDKGNFPLNHDTIMKVYYNRGSGASFQYFSVCSQDTGILADVLCKLSIVSKVEIVSVDHWSNNF